MQCDQEDAHSRFVLAQLWQVASNRTENSIESDVQNRAVDAIINNNFNINCRVTIKRHPVHLKNCTALHFVYYVSRYVYAFTKALERGADFTIKNANGQTALHLIIANSLENTHNNDIPFVNSVLSAHVKLRNSTNPRDDRGVTHLHAACMANHVESLKLFLESGADADEAVNFDAPQWAGYTPLHVAAKFNNFEAVQTLLKYGANVCAKDANSMTPLDLIVKYRLNQLNFTSGLYVDYHDREETRPKDLLDSEKIVKLLLDEQCPCTVGLSRFHVACTLNDLTIARSLLDRMANFDHAVPIESAVCPGYTPLHFAAISGIDAVKMLLTRGANLEIEDADGSSPFDICVNNYGVRDLTEALSCTEVWREIFLSDGKTTLLDLLSSTMSVDRFRSFVKNCGANLVVPSDSPLLPGCSLLHLATIFAPKIKCEREGFWYKYKDHQSKYDDGVVNACLTLDSLDVNAQDSRGRTAVHLAYRLGKGNIVDVLLNRLDRLRNLADDENLSYLHIACAMKRDAIVERLLENSTPNVAYEGRRIFQKFVVPGSTPLHVAAATGTREMAVALLGRGADLHATDQNGFAPIHYLLQYPYPGGVFYEHDPRTQHVNDVYLDALLENPRDLVVEAIGLSYLHVASRFGHARAVEKLLDLGSNVNAVVNYEKLGHRRLMYSTCAPLHLAQSRQVVKLLLRRGADVFAESSKELSQLNCSAPLKDSAIVLCFMSVLYDHEEMQKRAEERLGLTKLHVACYLKKKEAVERILADGDVDVNVRVYEDSVVFGGYTPLHLLMIFSHTLGVQVGPMVFAIDEIIRLLLECGADVTIVGVREDTPIHLFHYFERYFTDAERCKNLLLSALRDFSVNPVNDEGWSHFHLACSWHHVEAVKNFLQRGSVDVNQPTDYFIHRTAGLTPLHSTLTSSMGPGSDWTKLLDTVDLLLENGANVAARDTHGCTCLHERAVLLSPGMILLDKLVKHGADVRAINVRGRTLFDIWPFISDIDYASIFEKYGYPINSWNATTGEGCISKIFLSWHDHSLSQSTKFKKLIESADVKAEDEMGRTVIHNAVADSHAFRNFDNCIFAIECFLSRGVDIDQQDQSGQTALHYAARMQNKSGIEALLKCGADINIVDNSGESALSYDIKHKNAHVSATGTRVKKTTEVLNMHMKKLQHLELEVSQLNEELAANLKPNLNQGLSIFFQPFCRQLEMTKTVSVGSSTHTVFDFLKETGVATWYPFMSATEQVAIDDYFKSNAYNEFDELTGIIRLQYNKMKKRLDFIKSALTSLRTLLGFSVPGLCEEITRLLTNSDLKSLIASTTEEKLNHIKQ